MAWRHKIATLIVGRNHLINLQSDSWRQYSQVSQTVTITHGHGGPGSLTVSGRSLAVSIPTSADGSSAVLVSSTVEWLVCLVLKVGTGAPLQIFRGGHPPKFVGGGLRVVGMKMLTTDGSSCRTIRISLSCDMISFGLAVVAPLRRSLPLMCFCELS